MDWLTVAQLIVSVGLPAVEKIIANWENKLPVTVAEIQKIRDMADQQAKDRMRLAVISAGIDPTSPQGIALLAAAS